MNKKIILITLGKSNPDKMNGVNKIVHQLAEKLHMNGHSVVVWGITPNISNNVSQSYPIKLFKKSIFNTLLWKEILSERNCVVHFHGCLIPIYFLISLLLTLKNIPWVLTPHGSLLKKSLSRKKLIKYPYLWVFERFIIKNAQATQVITQQEYDELPFTKNAVIIPNATSITTSSTKIIHPDQIIFGYVGRMCNGQKGLDILIQGFKAYQKNNSQSQLWMIGDGKDRQYLEKQVMKWKLQSDIRFFGECHSKVKDDLFRQMDVFIHCSRWDVLPTSVLEAANHQLPLIVSKETGFANMMTDYKAGFILENNTPADLTGALSTAAHYHRNNHLKTLGNNAKIMISDQFNWDSVMPQIITKLYGMAAP